MRSRGLANKGSKDSEQSPTLRLILPFLTGQIGKVSYHGLSFALQYFAWLYNTTYIGVMPLLAVESMLDAPMKIFVSFASEDRNIFAEPIALTLGASHEVFFDRDTLPAGSDFNTHIRNYIAKSDVLVFLISPESVCAGSYALSELEFAKDRWSHPKGHVLPVMVRQTDMDGVPNYLKAVTILEPVGNVAAEVAAAVEKLNAPDFLNPINAGANAVTPPVDSWNSLENRNQQAVALLADEEILEYSQDAEADIDVDVDTTTTEEIEIVINRKFEDYSENDQKKFLSAIARLLEIDEAVIKITKKRKGSVKLTISLPKDKVNTLLELVKSGTLSKFDVVSARKVQSHWSEIPKNELHREIIIDKAKARDSAVAVAVATATAEATAAVVTTARSRIIKELAISTFDNAFALAYKYLQREDLAFEVVSDAFFVLLTMEHKRFSEIKHLDRYLIRAAIYGAWNLRKKEDNYFPIIEGIDTDWNEEENFFHRIFIKKHPTIEVERIFSLLSSKNLQYAQILRFYYIEALSHKEIAESMQISIIYSKALLSRAKMAFRQIYLSMYSDDFGESK